MFKENIMRIVILRTFKAPITSKISISNLKEKTQSKRIISYTELFKLVY